MKIDKLPSFAGIQPTRQTETREDSSTEATQQASNRAFRNFRVRVTIFSDLGPRTFTISTNPSIMPQAILVRSDYQGVDVQIAHEPEELVELKEDSN